MTDEIVGNLAGVQPVREAALLRSRHRRLLVFRLRRGGIRRRLFVGGLLCLGTHQAFPPANDEAATPGSVFSPM
ncbi:hypothetical protein SDC9_176042 [bioreactor metagenome]|uniref:Uncharacterized protein n=1 Tax=bioreactor metagenome TaxID=1076179 RepID=A0A645GQU5_9ZZZZ